LDGSHDGRSSTEPTSAEKFARQVVAYVSSSCAGQLVLDALADDDVTEVYLNPDGEAWGWSCWNRCGR